MVLRLALLCGGCSPCKQWPASTAASWHTQQLESSISLADWLQLPCCGSICLWCSMLSFKPSLSAGADWTAACRGVPQGYDDASPDSVQRRFRRLAPELRRFMAQNLHSEAHSGCTLNGVRYARAQYEARKAALQLWVVLDLICSAFATQVCFPGPQLVIPGVGA